MPRGLQASGRHTTSSSKDRDSKDGKLETPAYVTVFHNGVLTQAHTELLGNTPPKAVG
jgi:hypothetical protein